MADIRLDNAAGAFTLLSSAAEGFALETAGLFIGPLRDGTEGFTDQLSSVVLVLQELNSETGLTEETADSAGNTIVAIAQGIKEGFETVIDVWVTLRSAIVDTIKEFSGASSEMIFDFTKIATIVAVVGAVLAPVFLAVGGIAFFITSVLVPAFAAVGTVVAAVFGGSVLPILGAVGAVFLLLRRPLIVKAGDAPAVPLVRLASPTLKTLTLHIPVGHFLSGTGPTGLLQVFASS